MRNCTDKMADPILLPIFAANFTVLVWKQHFLYFIWKEIHKMVNIGSRESWKKTWQPVFFWLGFGDYWDKFSFCKKKRLGLLMVIWPSKFSNDPQKMLKGAKHGPQKFRPGDNTVNRSYSRNPVYPKFIWNELVFRKSNFRGLIITVNVLEHHHLPWACHRKEILA